MNEDEMKIVDPADVAEAMEALKEDAEQEASASAETTPDAVSNDAEGELKQENSEETVVKTEVTEKDYNGLKSDMCGCGASFVDEIIRVAPWVIAEVEKGDKTLHGFFNYCYTYSLREYIKTNGRKNGGAWCDISEMAKKYFSEEVKEGTVFEEEKVEFAPPPKPAPDPLAREPKKPKAKKSKTVERVSESIMDKIAESSAGSSEVSDTGTFELSLEDLMGN